MNTYAFASLAGYLTISASKGNEFSISLRQHRYNREYQQYIDSPVFPAMRHARRSFGSSCAAAHNYIRSGPFSTNVRAIGFCGRIADMTVPEGGFATEWIPTGGIKPDMAFLALLADILAAILLCLDSSSRCHFAPFATIMPSAGLAIPQCGIFGLSWQWRILLTLFLRF
jgi:hypothetical protein